MSAVEYQQVLGRRIAQERRRHGLSQPELAALLDRPVAWVSQLEKGVQPIEAQTVLQTVADVLDLTLTDLTGLTASEPAAGPRPVAQPGSFPADSVSFPADSVSRRAGAPAPCGPAAAEALRVVLAGAHSLCAMLGDQPAPPVAWLRSSTDLACALARAERFGEMAGLLADLMPGLEAAVREVAPAEQPAVYELMAVAYQACAAALARLEDPEGAWVAAGHAMSAAERAGNLLLVAASAHRLASVFAGARRYSLAEETARTTVAALEPLADIGDPDAVALCGALTLLRAAVAARLGRQRAAHGQLARARQLAARLGEQRAGGAPEFGPDCVALYEITVSVDLGDAGHALRVAAATDLAGWPPDRQVRLLVGVARAFAQREQVEEATAALVRAETIGPGHLRGSDQVREVLADLLTLHATPPIGLAGLQGRLLSPAPAPG